MTTNTNNNGRVTTAQPLSSKNRWIRVAGAAALLAAGFILYRKRQTSLGGALMTSSLNVLTSAAM